MGGQSGAVHPLIFKLDLVPRELLLIVVVIPLYIRRLPDHLERALIVGEDAHHTIGAHIEYMPALGLDPSREFLEVDRFLLQNHVINWGLGFLPLGREPFVNLVERCAGEIPGIDITAVLVEVVVHSRIGVGGDAQGLPIVPCLWFEATYHGVDRQFPVFVDLVIHKLDEAIEAIFRYLQAGGNHIINGSFCYDALLDTVLHHTMAIPAVAPHREVVVRLAVVNTRSLVSNEGVVRFGLVHYREKGIVVLGVEEAVFTTLVDVDVVDFVVLHWCRWIGKQCFHKKAWVAHKGELKIS